jgi:hypothetical protein
VTAGEGTVTISIKNNAHLGQRHPLGRIPDHGRAARAVWLKVDSNGKHDLNLAATSTWREGTVEKFLSTVPNGETSAAACSSSRWT